MNLIADESILSHTPMEFSLFARSQSQQGFISQIGGLRDDQQSVTQVNIAMTAQETRKLNNIHCNIGKSGCCSAQMTG